MKSDVNFAESLVATDSVALSEPVARGCTATPECTTKRPESTVDAVETSRGERNMGFMSTDPNDRNGLLQVVDAAGAAALDFLERSRDVANEVVVDDARAETSTSGREKASRSGTGPAV